MRWKNDFKYISFPSSRFFDTKFVTGAEVSGEAEERRRWNNDQLPAETLVEWNRVDQCWAAWDGIFHGYVSLLTYERTPLSFVEFWKKIHPCDLLESGIYILYMYLYLAFSNFQLQKSWLFWTIHPRGSLSLQLDDFQSKWSHGWLSFVVSVVSFPNPNRALKSHGESVLFQRCTWCLDWVNIFWVVFGQSSTEAICCEKCERINKNCKL